MIFSQTLSSKQKALEINLDPRIYGAFAEIGADAVMVEGLENRDAIDKVCNAVPGTTVAVNLIHGGKTPPVTISQLENHGVKMVIYSTPCLFAAQSAIKKILSELKDADGLLSDEFNQVSLTENNYVLNQNAENVYEYYKGE